METYKLCKVPVLRKLFCLFIGISVLIGSSGCTTPQEDTINVSGAWALYPLMVKWVEEYTALHPDIRIDVSAGGAGKGMADTLGGLVDIGMISREIYPEEIEKGAFYITVARDAVVPIVNKNNPYFKDIISHGMSREAFYAIYITGEVTTWGDVLKNPHITDTIQAYTRSDACGAAKTWALYLGFAQEDLRGVGVYGDPGVVEAVSNDKYGIGYANLNFAYDIITGSPAPGIAVIPIDLDSNGIITDYESFYQTKLQVIDAIIEGMYPSPPARDLYLVTKGDPKGIVKDFLIWILTDGQQYVAETGYISLGDILEEELKKLEE
ncbi:MAG: substrate-binding domain-containing protein [Theionarchaea archaeon]|nr:substrate-binding domain-containing protein [Theionarchaea archaeon]